MEREEAEWEVQRHGQTVYRLAYARTGNREDAEDVTQETFLRLVRAAPKFRDEDPLPGLAAAGGGPTVPRTCSAPRGGSGSGP